jgi:excisionase family DNA binding protein
MPAAEPKNSLLNFLMPKDNGCGLIVGIQNLAKYLNVSKQTVSQYISMGMPCGRVGNRWHFHAENVDVWLKKITNRRYAGATDPQSLESEG